jgi:hypothetical protein
LAAFRRPPSQATTPDCETFGAPEAPGWRLETSGALFMLSGVTLELARGGSLDLYYDYTVRLRDDGLPADRSWGFCAPIFPTPCAPEPSGYEQASVELVVGAVDSRRPDPYVTVIGQSLVLGTDAGSFADGVTQSGRLHVHAEVSADPVAPALSSVDFSLYALLTVDESPLSPIPEPESALLVLAGVAALLWRARWASS